MKNFIRALVEATMILGSSGRLRGIRNLLLVLALAMLAPACGKGRKQGLTITGFTPIGGTVPRQTIVYISFDRALDPNTWPTSFTWRDLGGTDVAATISFNSTTNQIILKPSGGTPLAGATTYQVVVLGTLKGADGTTFSGAAFQFTTQAATATNGGQPTFSGLTSATAPALPTTGQIDLVWTAATDAPDNDTVHYDIYMSTVPNGEDLSSPPFQSTGNSTGVSITGLASGVTFYFIVRAREITTGNIEFNTTEKSDTTK